MAKQLLNTIEIKFWHMIIPLMTESPVLQKVVNLGYATLQHYHPLPGILKGIFWACMGWTFGLTIGLLGAALF